MCYLAMLDTETIYLLAIFSKSEKANLTPAERNRFKQWIGVLKQQHRGEP